MAYQLFQLPKQLNISSSFTLSAGARAYFFETGTSTPLDTYSDSGLTTPHAHPVVADAAGVLPAIYLDPESQYKLTLNSSSDTLIYTVDPVNDQPVSADVVTDLLTQSIIGGLLFPQTSAEVSASVTPSNKAYPPGDIRRTGAASGSNSSTAIQAAIDQAMQATGAAVTIPQGLFTADARLEADDSVAMYGQGYNSVIKGAASGTAILLLIQDTSTAIPGVRLRDIVFDGNDGGQLNAGLLQLNNAQDFVVDSCVFKDGTLVSGSSGVNGIALAAASAGPAPSGVITNCIADNNSKPGFNISTGCDGVTITNSTSRDNTGNGTATGFQLQDSFNSKVIDSVSTGNEGCGILITAITDDDPAHHLIARNRISGNGTGTNEGDGIQISNSTGGVVHFETDIIENDIGANGAGVTGGTSAVTLVNASSVRVCRNRIRDTSLHGVHVEADNSIDSSYIKINDNDIADGNTVTNASGAAIFIDGVVDYLEICRNTIRNRGGFSGYRYGVHFTSDCEIDHLVMRDNDFSGMVTANHIFQGTFTNFDIEIGGTFQTTADGPTTVLSFPIADNASCRVRVTVEATQDDGSNRADYVSEALFYRDGGSATLQGSVATIVAPIESDAGWDIDLGVTSNSFRLRVDGGTSQTVNWKWKAEAWSI